jgi:hypothetical protein
MTNKPNQPTLQELKSEAYDALANMEAWKARVFELNTAIGNFKAPETDSAQEDKSKK